MLYLLQRVLFGSWREPRPHGPTIPIRDLSLREVAALAPLAVFIVWIGVQPRPFLDRMAPTLDRLAQPAESRLRLSNEPAVKSSTPAPEVARVP